jgi:peptide-methionine (S)-S-oxide reductase
MFNFSHKTRMPPPDEALTGRANELPLMNRHYVNGHPIKPPFPEGMEMAKFGMGCFWGAERLFWYVEGVYTTAVGYSGGHTPNPTYAEVCTGRTGHAEVVLVVFNPGTVRYDGLLGIFWEAHDPTQGMRQGNDVGTQYRSAIYIYNEDQKTSAENSRGRYQQALAKAGMGRITTEITQASEFYYAEDYHQQYLAKNSGGYCGLGGTGVICPVD